MDNGYTQDSAAGGAATPATPAADASNAPAQPVLTTTDTAPATGASIPETPLQNMTPTEHALKQDSWGTKVYHGVLNALGGSGDVSYARDPTTGKLTATPVASGPGTQWKRIIAGALSGFGAAAQAGTTGPGGALRGAGAGVAAGMGMARQRDQQARQDADQDFEAQQKAALQKANLSMLNMQTSRLAYENASMKVEDAQKYIDRENQFAKAIKDGGEGSIDLGNVDNEMDAYKMANQNPKLHTALATGFIQGVPHIVFNDKGEPTVQGMHYAIVTPSWLDSKSNPETPVTQQIKGADGKLRTVNYTIPKDSIPRREWISTIHMQAQDDLKNDLEQKKQTLEEKKETSEEKLRAGQTAQAYAGAEKDRSETAVLNNATDQNTLNSNAQQLVDGTMDPTNLSKRSKTYDATLAAANAYSLSKYGKPFDIAKAAGDYKFATNTQTYNTLNYLNSLVGRDNQSGNLGTVVAMADQLKQGNYPPINAIDQWAKIAGGDSKVAAYQTALVEVADQVAKVLQGGGTGSSTSDKKLQQGIDILNKNFNRQQLKEVSTTFRELLGNRKREIIGDNRYLQQWHGVQQPGGGPQTNAPGGTAPAATPLKVQPGEPTAKGANGETLVVRGGKWVAAQP
jgi:hypothetical protein